MSSFVETVLRARDLLYVQFEFVNLTLNVTATGSAQLQRVPGQAASIVIRLPPQHIAEEVFNSTDPRHFPYNASLASPSRLAFDIPDAVALPDFSVQAILDLVKKLPLRPANLPLGDAPATVIELPYRLLLGPAPAAQVFHRSTPLANDDPLTDVTWTGLWSTRVGAGASLAQPGPNLRALPNPVDTGTSGFNTALTGDQRREIARLSQAAAAPFVISCQRLLLSPLGASAQLKSNWPSSTQTTLKLWEHHTDLGRDEFVRTIEEGFLFPFGHRASKETIFRRDFFMSTAGTVGNIAELQKEIFIKVEELERSYESAVGYDYGGREMPLKRVRVASQPASLPDDRSPVRVTVTAIDNRRQVISLDLNMLFISNVDAANPTTLSDVYNRYLTCNTAALMPQPVALAEDREARGDTTLTVTGLAFGAKIVSAQPPFLPLMQNATVSMPTLEQLFGSVANAVAGNTPATRTLTLHDDYLRGFASGDTKQIFANLYPPLPGLPIPAERAGGLTAPTFSPSDGLSRVRGLVSDVADFAHETSIDPEKIIADAKLLGMIPLKALVDTVLDNVPVDDPAKLFTTIDQPGVFATRPILNSVETGASAAEVRFIWKPRLKAGGLPPLLIPTSQGPMTLTVRGRITRAPAGSPTFEVDGALANFGLAFTSLPTGGSPTSADAADTLLTVEFKQVTFQSGASRKMEFATDIAGVTFGDGLAFIVKLIDLLPKGNPGGNVQIEPRPNGVTVRFAATVPSFAVGVLSIQNIAVSTSISLPFVEGQPAAVRFALAERNQPFLVSVSIFGGTGFFSLEVRTDHSVLIEAAVEFGGAVSINLLGIVRGGVHLFAGVYVALDVGNSVIISGYLRLGGYVDVAGIISVSIEIYIGLTYDSSTHLLLGRGTVTVSVKVLFFSLTKSFTVERKIAGFGDSPTLAATFDDPALPNFTDTMTRFQWDQYCKAFA